jgi:hypothetical protein
MRCDQHHPFHFRPRNVAEFKEVLDLARCTNEGVYRDICGDSYCLEHGAERVFREDMTEVRLYLARLIGGAEAIALSKGKNPARAGRKVLYRLARFLVDL